MKAHKWIAVNKHIGGGTFIYGVCAKCGCQNIAQQHGNGGRMGLGKVTTTEAWILDGQTYTKRPNCKEMPA